MISRRQQIQDRPALYGGCNLPICGHQYIQRDDDARDRHALAVAVPEIAAGEERQPHAIAGQALDLSNALAKRIGDTSWIDHIGSGFFFYARSHRTPPHYSERLHRRVVTIQRRNYLKSLRQIHLDFAATSKNFGPNILEGQGDEPNSVNVVSSNGSALSCTDHSGIPRPFPQKSRDAACRAGTLLSFPGFQTLRGCFGPTKRQHTLRASLDAMSAQLSAGYRVNSNHQIASSPQSSSRSPVAHRSAA